MANLAAVLLAAKAPLEIQEVEIYEPGPDELLLKNEIIAFSPFDYKIGKLGRIPLQYPAILGSSFGGTIEAVGQNVTNFKVGDKVVSAVGNQVLIALTKLAPISQYGGWQRYVVAAKEDVSKVPNGIDMLIPATLIANLATVVGLFTGRVGLNKPTFDGPVSAKDKKVLIYGGSSSSGSLSVQYVTQAGYTVITTTSPKNKKFVSKLGAAKVIDHTQDQDSLIKNLIAEGPYDVVLDSISSPDTIAVNAAVLAAQGGGKIYAFQRARDEETLPKGVTREFASWPTVLLEEKNSGLLDWAYTTYLPQGVSSGKILTLPNEKISGGLKGVNEALDRLEKGVSGVKLVLDPWE